MKTETFILVGKKRIVVRKYWLVSVKIRYNTDVYFGYIDCVLYQNE